MIDLIDFLMVSVATGLARGRVRMATTVTTESSNIPPITADQAKLIFVGFLWLGHIDLLNVKQKGREKKLTGIEVAREIPTDSRRGFKKGGENGSEQYHLVWRVKSKGDETNRKMP